MVAALVVEDGKFMICQRPAHKARGLLWEFVGGKVEPGETKAQALIRECREELGVIVAPGPAYMAVDHVYPDITIRLTLLPQDEIRTSVIGEMVMDALKKIDEVAYVRFASVYRQFKDVNSFMEELQDMLKK